ncbi:hypothetical protein LDENG_00288590 [Lucifuga dentata]|nr:hypothetical protein LDENG_00288590 [Lucifuga dentata]
MYLSAIRVSLQIFLLTSTVLCVSEVYKLTVTPGNGTTLNIRKVKGSQCTVCSGTGRSQQCHASLMLRDNTAASVEFKCSRPQDVFSVEIVRNIECTAKSCNGDIIQSESDFLPLLDFNRTFTWNLKASSTPQVFQIDFSRTGLRQINLSESCPDQHTYTLQAFQTTRKVAIGKYCRTGFISSAQVLDQGSLSLDVPAGQKLQKAQFDVSVAEKIKSLAKIKLILPEGTSSSELLSPNYPDTFPDDDLMEWCFQVPTKHTAVVRFLNLTQPQCLKKATAVEYYRGGRAEVRKLTDPQLVQTEGDFSLTLKNCEMDRRRANSPGLALSFRVSVSRTHSTVLCSVDPRAMKGFSLYIEKLKAASDCEMKKNSVPLQTITVPSDGLTQLSFHNCLPLDIRVVTTKVIECNQLKDCPKHPIPLVVPTLPSCLPAPLSSVTWTLRAPPQGTVELQSPSFSLKQSLPGKPCNNSIFIRVAEDDGTFVGNFCSQGAIQKIQIHTNVSVTVSNMDNKPLRLSSKPVLTASLRGEINGNKPLRLSSKPVLTASLRGEINEGYIFFVSPKKDLPILLATPGWPEGMKSYSTVSWIISVPPKMEAHLMFANLSQPKCNRRHTNIRVQRIGYLEKDYSRREDEEADSEITVSENFYLNMSNCMPETGHFSAITGITLQKNKNLLLIIIMSVVAALLVIFVIVLAVICVVIRKKKKQMNHQVSIYNPNGTSFLPGHNSFPKTREDNESHIYASIDDSMVYTHLLRKGEEMNIYGESDTYQSFMGQKDPQESSVCKDTGAEDLEVGVYQSFPLSSQQAPTLPNRPLSHGQSMVDNHIHCTEDHSKEEELSPDVRGSTDLGLRLEPEGGN